MMDWVKLVTAFNVVVAVCLWVPAWVRMHRRASSSDYSVWSFVSVLWLQCSNCAIAAAQHRGVQTWWFAINAVTVGVTLAHILWFHNGDKREGVGF